ncbi:MAG: ABC transporter permease [Phycisphaerae bacterium]|nr:ABC transporter permease [Gemmatimonadaceae bacterium]
MTAPTGDSLQSNNLTRELREIALELHAARNLVYQLTLRDIRVRYKQAVMGFAWAVFSPVLIVAAGVVMRVAMLHMSGERMHAGLVATIVVKGLAWAFFAGAIGFATTALTGNAALISKVYFPRAALTLSVVLACAFDSLIATSVMALFLPMIGWRPTSAFIWVPLLIVLLFLFTLAVSLLVSCANLFFRDVKYITQSLITFGIFFTPVFFEPSVLGGKWIPWQMLNPLAPLLEGLRLSAVSGHNLLAPVVQAGDGALVWTPWYLIYSASVAVLGLLGSVVLFHRAQYQFAEYV